MSISIRRLRFSGIALLYVGGATAAMAQQVPLPTQSKPIELAYRDTTYPACTNFFQYANGTWLKNNPIPPQYPTWGTGIIVALKSNQNLQQLLGEAAQNRATEKDPATVKLGTYYAACMDSAAVEKAGATPLDADLKRIAAIATPADVRSYLAERHAAGFPLVFGYGAIPDFKNSSQMVGFIDQGGLGLPNRDYYFRTDAKSLALRDAYVAHVRNDLVLAGETPASADADSRKILALETALAQPSQTPVERRDPGKLYNVMTRAQLTAAAPGMNWQHYFDANLTPGIASVVVGNPRFITAADSLLSTAPVAEWKAYFRWNLVRAMASTLSSPFVNESLDFSKQLAGVSSLPPRALRCSAGVDAAMGEALGKTYVERYFPASAKARAVTMVDNLKASLRDRLATRSWMSDSTRKMAYAKLDAFVQKIGYPDKWKDYSALRIDPSNSFYADAAAVQRYEAVDDRSKISKPVDRTLWGMTPATVNAYYNPLSNEIVFPAAILQPPFFDPKADDAVNYGAMGAIIGHEMTHGFDDEGAQFDAQGNLRQWFAPGDLKAFHELTDKYAAQFSNHTVLDSLHLNGKLTNGENIADLGGLTVAYYALEKALDGKPRTLIDGLTPEQRFFLSYAQAWRNNQRDESLRTQVQTDPHSPAIWRVNGPLANMPEFAKAWGCKPGDAMDLPASARVEIW